MDNEKKIEIPFGAFDSELIHQEINIPKGFKAVVNGNKIILTRIESDDEKVRKELIKHLKEGVEGYMPAGDSSDYQRWLVWLEKQSDSPIKWNKNTKDCKPKVSHSVLMKTTHGIAEGEWQGEQWHQYRWAGLVRDADVLSWMELYNLEKQDEQKPAVEIKTPEESLGIDSDTYNEIVDECIYGEQKSQRMISAEAKEAMYDKPADKVEPKCEESKTKVFDTPTPFEDKLYAFVLACEILVDPSKREFILEHSQEILDAAKEQIGKERESAWSKEDEHTLQGVINEIQANKNQAPDYDFETYDRFLSWLKSLKERYTWKPSNEQIKVCKEVYADILSVKGFDLGTVNSELNRLEEQLKKLSEE